MALQPKSNELKANERSVNKLKKNKKQMGFFVVCSLTSTQLAK